MDLSDSALSHLQSTLERPISIAARYEIAEEIGRGGMGSVYRAFDRELERDVALKVLARAELDPRAMERLKREARIAARLEHPGIVPVHDVGALDDGRPYYVMKLVSGARLDELIASSASKDERIDVFLKICEAVAYAHASGVVHRDLKPENVRVGAFGEVQVLDFGVAKLLESSDAPPKSDAAACGAAGARDANRASSAALTRPSASAGAIIGTPGWMAPEQARGDADVDARADVHALGALLAALCAPIEVPRRRVLDAIVAKARANERERRYPKAEELADDVRRWRAGEAANALPEDWIARCSRLAGRHRVAIVLVLAYVLMRVLFALFGPRHVQEGRSLGMFERMGEIREPSGTIVLGGMGPCLVMLDRGDGLYPVHADRAADGRLRRVRVQLHDVE